MLIRSAADLSNLSRPNKNSELSEHWHPDKSMHGIDLLRTRFRLMCCECRRWNSGFSSKDSQLSQIGHFHLD